MGEGRGEGYGLRLPHATGSEPQAPLPSDPSDGRGIHWRRAEFVGLMPHVQRSDPPYVGGYFPATGFALLSAAAITTASRYMRKDTTLRPARAVNFHCGLTAQ